MEYAPTDITTEAHFWSLPIFSNLAMLLQNDKKALRTLAYG
jgi:hypothetical protein